MPTQTTDKHPNKDFSVIGQTGLKAHALATKYKAEIEPRLPSGTIDGLASNLLTLGVLVPGAEEARASSKAAKVGQDVALEHAYALVTAIRMAVSLNGAGADIRKEYGVGLRTNPKVVKDVKTSIGLILDRAKAHPQELQGMGIVPEDIKALTAAFKALEGADQDQEKRRANAPVTTQDRNKTARTILTTIERISGVGVLAFATNPTVRAHFDALVGQGNSKKKKAKPADATPRLAGKATKPADTTTRLAGKAAKPAGKAAKPADTTAKPADMTAKPAKKTAKPAKK